MTGKTLLSGLAVAVAVFLLISAGRDLVRYVRISRM
jgi:hypothetical protein